MPDLTITISLLETLITCLEHNIALARRHPHLHQAQLDTGVVAERERTLASHRAARAILQEHHVSDQ